MKQQAEKKNGELRPPFFEVLDLPPLRGRVTENCWPMRFAWSTEEGPRSLPQQ